MASCWDSTNFSRHSSSIRPPDQINALAMHFSYPKHQKFIPEFVRLLRILRILSTHKTNVIPSSRHPVILDRAPTLSSKVTLETLLFEESIEWRLGAVVVRTGTPFGSSSNFSFRHSFGDAYMRLLNVQNNAKTPLNLQKSDCARTEVLLVVSRSDLKIIQKYQKAGMLVKQQSQCLSKAPVFRLRDSCFENQLPRVSLPSLQWCNQHGKSLRTECATGAFETFAASAVTSKSLKA